MSLDVYLEAIPAEKQQVYWANITHNMVKMAEAAGLYKPMWCPEECGITKARQLLPELAQGLDKLLANPEHYKTFNPDNGWGDYDAFVRFVRAYIAACDNNPDADIRVSR